MVRAPGQLTSQIKGRLCIIFHMFVEWRKAWLNWAAASFVLFYTLALLTIQRQTHDLVALNDFWGNAWLAAVWDWNDPASWPNGFHPVGFTVLLHEVCRPTVDHYDIQRSVGHINCVLLRPSDWSPSGPWPFVVSASIPGSWRR